MHAYLLSHLKMTLRTLVLGAALTTLNTSQLPGQTSAPFGRCAFWQDHKPDPTKPDVAEFNKAYRIGFAHGFVLGTLGGLPSDAYSDPRWAALEKQYGIGLGEALQRPAFIVDAFDQKCGDYRNRGILLSDIGLVVLLEVGGVSSQGIERALEIMRAGGDGYKERAIEALLASK